VLMDDIEVSANAAYLDISANIDKSSGEPAANVIIDVKKQVEQLTVTVAILVKLNGEYKEILPQQKFNPCKSNGIADMMIKNAVDQIGRFGNLTLTCPMKTVNDSITLDCPNNR